MGDDGSMTDVERQRVSMTLSADPRLVRVVRLTAGAVADLAGFDVDEIDDLRIAVDELCAALLESGRGGELNLDVRLVEGGAVHISGSTEWGDVPLDDERFYLARQILGAVADDHGLETSDGVVTCWMHQRPNRPSDAAADR